MRIHYTNGTVIECGYSMTGMCRAILGMYDETPTVLRYELAGRDY